MAEVPSPRILSLKSNLGRIQFESRPHIFNVANRGSKEYALDERHPLYLSAVTKLMDFDHNELHWRVKTSSKLFPRATIRSYAIRRARDGIIKELKRRGYDNHGRVIPSPPEHKQMSRRAKADLKGAMALDIDRDVLTMSLEATDVSCQEIVGWLISKQNQKPPPSRRDSDDRYNHPFEIRSYLMAKQYVEDLRNPNLDLANLNTK